MKRVFALTALVMALAVMFCLPTAAQAQQVYRGLAQSGGPPVGTEEPCILNPCLLYSGDFDPNGQNPNGLWNNSSELFGITGAVFVPFIVPKKFEGAKGKTDWNVTGLFVNELMDIPVAPSVTWAIVQGVVAGGNPNKVTTICSGTGVPTLTPTGRSFLGLTEYTILLVGLSCPTNIEAGEYWLEFLPTVESLGYLGDDEDNSPANAQGPGIAPPDDAFFLSPAFGFSTFTDASMACGSMGCDRFSFGVIGLTVH